MTVVVACAFLDGGCAASSSGPAATTPHTIATATTEKPAPRPDDSLTAAADYPLDTLPPGVIGLSFVGGAKADATIAWRAPVTSIIEFVGVANGVAYVTTDRTVEAISLADGNVLWNHATTEEGDYQSSGGSSIALDGGTLWVISPYEANLHLDIATGKTISVGPWISSESLPPSFTPIPAPPATTWTVKYAFNGVGAYDATGVLVWILRPSEVIDGMALAYDDSLIVQTGDLILIPSEDGHLYAIKSS